MPLMLVMIPKLVFFKHGEFTLKNKNTAQHGYNLTKQWKIYFTN